MLRIDFQKSSFFDDFRFRINKNSNKPLWMSTKTGHIENNFRV